MPLRLGRQPSSLLVALTRPYRTAGGILVAPSRNIDSLAPVVAGLRDQTKSAGRQAKRRCDGKRSSRRLVPAYQTRCWLLPSTNGATSSQYLFLSPHSAPNLDHCFAKVCPCAILRRSLRPMTGCSVAGQVDVGCCGHPQSPARRKPRKTNERQGIRCLPKSRRISTTWMSSTRQIGQGSCFVNPTWARRQDQSSPEQPTRPGARCGSGPPRSAGLRRDTPP